MNIRKTLSLVIVVIVSLSILYFTSTNNRNWVGDISIKNANSEKFELCNNSNDVLQYFHFDQGLQYDGEKKEMINQFKLLYQPVNNNESGLIRIRFIVNCNGQSGLHEVISSDENYLPYSFNEKITNQLVEITKSLKGWKVLQRKKRQKDYYMYLIFVIHDGNIKEILP